MERDLNLVLQIMLLTDKVVVWVVSVMLPPIAIFFPLFTLSLLGVFFTMLVSLGLSKTLLKGLPSSFTLELPPYRKLRIGQVIVRSVFDRTLFVLGRALKVLAPVGLLIWLLANLSIGQEILLNHFIQLVEITTSDAVSLGSRCCD